MNLGTATIIRGDARHLPLPDNSVDLICTSPPYFALRSYQDNGEHYDGQIGSEATPTEFLDALIECTREWIRILKPTGSIWINLGDKYAGSDGQNNNGTGSSTLEGGIQIRESGRRDRAHIPRAKISTEIRPKSLMGIPWRYALRCIDELGLILRAEVIWSKPNGLPESVTDRVRRSHETWFHFTLQPRYFAAVDEIREGYEAKPQRRITPAPQVPYYRDQGQQAGNLMRSRLWDEPKAGDNPLGKLPGSVREIPTEPLTVPDHLGVDHFAAFPTAWPKWIIQGWSPAGICIECGDGRRPVVARETTSRVSGNQMNGRREDHTDTVWSFTERTTVLAAITGYACACPTPEAPTRPSVVLDPFGGTGTTTLAARALGRHGISIDLSHDYSRLARWRTRDPAQLAKVLEIAKPPQQTVDQLDLFGGDAA